MGKSDRKIVIIGAGLAGLRIGQLLAIEGMNVEILESGAVVGGMLQTVQKLFMGDCYRFDLGPHLFFKEYASVYESLLKNAGGESLDLVQGEFIIKIKDKELLYPLKTMNMLGRLPISFTKRIIWDLIKTRFERKGDMGNTSVKLWMIQKFGDTLFESFFAPYIEKCTGLPAERISLKWATERTTVTGESLAQTLLKTVVESFRKVKSSNLPSSERMVAYYPAYGAGRIPLAMAADIEKHGGSIRLNSKLSSLKLDKCEIKSIVITDCENKQRTIEGDVFISTIPLPNLLDAFPREITTGISEASKRLNYRALLLANIIVNQDNILDHLEVFYPDRRFPFKRIYEPKKMSRKMAPKDRSSLVLEICCSNRESTDPQIQKHLIERSINMLEYEGLLKRQDVLDVFAIILPAAYPIYELGFEEIISTMEAFLSTIDNVVSCGRQGLFEYHAMTNETMEIAENVAHLILSGKRKSDVKVSGKWSKYFY